MPRGIARCGRHSAKRTLAKRQARNSSGNRAPFPRPYAYPCDIVGNRRLLTVTARAEKPKSENPWGSAPYHKQNESVNIRLGRMPIVACIRRNRANWHQFMQNQESPNGKPVLPLKKETPSRCSCQHARQGTVRRRRPRSSSPSRLCDAHARIRKKVGASLRRSHQHAYWASDSPRLNARRPGRASSDAGRRR